MRMKIVGTGSALPKRIVTNDELSQIVDTSDEWIRERTGIVQRRIATQETTTSMAVEAARKALEDAKVDPEQIDLVIVSTFTPDRSLPNTACAVQGAVGCRHAAAFEMNAACSGFLFALNTVYAYFSLGVYKTALIIGAETISKMIDWTDRSSCVLFGDGAGAAVVQMDNESENPYIFVQHADGEKGNVLTCDCHRKANMWSETSDQRETLWMDGQEVFRFAVRKVPECIGEVLEKANLSAKEVDWFFLHQANKRIVQSVAKRLNVEESKFPVNVDHYGNTSAASIPILLDEWKKTGRIKEGDRAILSGFGAGLTWGAALIDF